MRACGRRANKACQTQTNQASRSQASQRLPGRSLRWTEPAAMLPRLPCPPSPSKWRCGACAFARLHGGHGGADPPARGGGSEAETSLFSLSMGEFLLSRSGWGREHIHTFLKQQEASSSPGPRGQLTRGGPRTALRRPQLRPCIRDPTALLARCRHCPTVQILQLVQSPCPVRSALLQHCQPLHGRRH